MVCIFGSVSSQCWIVEICSRPRYGQGRRRQQRGLCIRVTQFHVLSVVGSSAFLGRDIIWLWEARSYLGTVHASHTALATNIGIGRERGRLRGMMYVQIVAVPLLAVSLEPTLGNWPNKAAARGEMEVFWGGVLLRWTLVLSSKGDGKEVKS